MVTYGYEWSFIDKGLYVNKSKIKKSKFRNGVGEFL